MRPPTETPSATSSSIMNHIATIFGFVMLLGAAQTSPAVVPSSPPNILFLFADDLAWDAVAFNGNKVVKTPNLDRLASQGCSFSQCYNMGSWSAAVCVASRTMLNTGRFAWRAGALDLNTETRQERSWAQLMARGGYDTYMTGKWHVDGMDVKASFQKLGTVRPGMAQTTKDVYQRSQAGGRWTPWDETLNGYWAGGKHWSVVTADEAVEFLDSRRGKEKPFFAYVAFNAPHDPRQSPKKFVDMYPPDAVDVPVNFLPLAPYYDKIGCGKALRDENLAPFPRTEGAVRLHRGEYYALITHLDEQIGRVLHKLEASGQAGNTLVIFTADHGLACGHHGLMGKQSMYEHSMRPPFILRGPGIPVGETRDARIYLQDAMPTALEAAGMKVPAHVEFKSLYPLIHDPKSPHYDETYGTYLNLQRCIIHENWKLTHYPKAEAWQLFDLARDPQEMHDLSIEPDQTVRLADLKKRLVALEVAMDDPLASKGPHKSHAQPGPDEDL